MRTQEFLGALKAETGLYYQRARYYDPRLGRFLSQDPIGLGGGVNWYAYAGGDPVNHRDPSGLDTYCAWAEGQTRDLGMMEVGGVPYSVSGATRRWSCTEMPDFNFDPADEGSGFVPASLGAGPGAGGGVGQPTPRPRVASRDYVLHEPGIEPVMAPWAMFYVARDLVPAGAAITRAALTPAARLAIRTEAGQALFRRGTWLNSGQYFRIGLGRNGGNEVFRMSGQLLETPFARWLGVRNGHVDIFDFGQIGRYR